MSATALAAGCSGSDSADTLDDDLSLKVASFDLVAGQTQRFQVGVVDNRDELVLVGGSVALSFRSLADGDVRTGNDVGPPDTNAEFVPLAGEAERPPTAAPRFEAGAAGVYRTGPITFTSPGFWEVEVTAATADGTRRAIASFSVATSSVIPRPGDTAPATANPLPGDAKVALHTIDSRADGDTGVPDPELHSTTIAAALAARRPMIVVVSTPTFCESRFCGPITDSVDTLARSTDDRVAFVHLEVWRDYDANELNPSTQEWIDPGRTHEGNEPWVFVVDRDGVIVERFDNVASDADLRRSLDRITS